MPFGLEEKTIKQIKAVFHQHERVKEALLFGSRALGTERPGSDIDLALKGENLSADEVLAIKKSPLIAQEGSINQNFRTSHSLLQFLYNPDAFIPLNLYPNPIYPVPGLLFQQNIITMILRFNTFRHALGYKI